MMGYNQNPDNKFRIIANAPQEDALDDLLSEAKALQIAMDETEDDEMESEELEKAYEDVISRLRLHFYRTGIDPELGLRELS